MERNHLPSQYISHIIAHRGASALAPENTLAAFRKAKEIGARWVEFDVMLAACGEVVVIHDETLERTTNGAGYVYDHPYRYLRTLDAGSWFSPHFTGERIPTLAQVIDVLYECNLAANIEIKPSLGHEERTVKRVLQVIDQCWRSTMPAPLISSFSRSVLECVRKHTQTHLLGYLMDEWHLDWDKSCHELNCVSVNTNHEILTADRIKEIKQTNRLLLAYTVDDFQRGQNLFDQGVDAVFSNCLLGSVDHWLEGFQKSKNY